MSKQKTRKRNGRRLYRLDVDAVCGRCRGPIPAGREHHRDVSGTAQHPACVRAGVTPAVPLERPHVPTVVRLVEAPALCPLCGDDTAGEPVVRVDGRARHRDCHRRERAG